MISVSTSNMSTLILAVDRFICIVMKPFQKYGFTIKQCTVAMCFGHMIIIIPPIIVSILLGNIENVLCIPVGNSIPLPFSILYFTCSTITFSTIAVLYTAIMSKVKHSPQLGESKKGSLNVLLRLGAVVVTNFIPSMTIASLSLTSWVPYVSGSFPESNVAFFLFPLNSSLNPLLNTLTTSKFLNDTAFQL